MSRRVRKKKSRFALFQGDVILRLANTYPTITLTLLEAVQNALDADAEKVFVGVDELGRVICVLDDGEGVTEEKFEQALQSVGRTVKIPRRGTLGRFGLGLISPLNKCKMYVFASHPKDSREANTWTFEGSKIQGVGNDLEIPCEMGASLPAIPSQFVMEAGQIYARWRTIVHLSEVTEDTAISTVDLDELENLIRVKFRKVMLQKGTTVHVFLTNKEGEAERRCIDASDYTGEPLEVFTHTEPRCGTVTFELYRARKEGGVRRGQVAVAKTGDPSPITWEEFRAQAMGWRKLEHLKEVFAALGSGYFEGVIYAEGIELEPDRRTFVRGDALVDLYVAIYAWYLDRGKTLYENEQESRREERYQNLGARSLQRLMELLDTQPFAAMARRLVGILPENTASQPPAMSKPGPGKAQAQKTRTTRGGDSKKRVVVDPPEREPRSPQDTRPSLSLRFAYEVLPGSTRLWEFDADEATLTFNVRHPTWVKLDETNGRHTEKNDRQIMHLQEWVAFELLVLLSHYDEPDFDLEVARLVMDEKVRLYAELFIAAK